MPSSKARISVLSKALRSGDNFSTAEAECESAKLIDVMPISEKTKMTILNF